MATPGAKELDVAARFLPQWAAMPLEKEEKDARTRGNAKVAPHRCPLQTYHAYPSPFQNGLSFQRIMVAKPIFR